MQLIVVGMFLGFAQASSTNLAAKSAECRVACHYVGYDDGYYKEKWCVCIDIRDYKQLVESKRITLPFKLEKPTFSE